MCSCQSAFFLASSATVGLCRPVTWTATVTKRKANIIDIVQMMTAWAILLRLMQKEMQSIANRISSIEKNQAATVQSTT